MDPLASGLLAFGLAAGSGALWFRRAMQVRLPADRRAFEAVRSAAALLAVIALFGGAGWLGGSAAALALLVSGFLLFTVAVSRQRVGPGAVSVGSPLPRFLAPDEHGASFDSASLSGHPALIKFFRGHW